ncbi:hypothetical protein EHR02_15665 [Leptospira levettii]|uniref:Glycosyltransferase RgtA/B/C/D-like domain-containing protein n=1 Tax=Leptospira paudalimensis TaxID=2950024 RepID=A0ABT3M6H9_9LEPT|nr:MULTISPECIES: hypothetical protein [Leptospira]MCW7503779.1 hypothetical protein [Leptospira paudalimensis]TGM94114.1 hypothetical protein EHR02_15665 [Leptospira levettii]
MNFHLSKKDKIILAIFFVFFLGLQSYLSATNSFISDSLAKAFQINSIQNGNESTTYPASSLDPDQKLHPVTFIIQNQHNLKSVFSASFAFLYAKLFFFLTVKQMIYMNVLFLLLSVLCLKGFGKVDINISILVITTSVVLCQVIDLSEVPFTLFLVCFVYSLWTMAIENQNTNLLIVSVCFSVLFSLFRLELLIFSGLLFVLSSLRLITLKKRKEIVFLTIAFLIPVSFFFLWNDTEYGHPLGIRYLFNYTEEHYFAKNNRLLNLQKILLTGFSDQGFKFGFFLISPYFLYPFYRFRDSLYSIRNQNPIHYHLTLFILYPILVGLSAPNDGITISARYVLFAVVPMIFIISHFWTELQNDKVFKILIIISILVNLIILRILKESFKMIKKTNQIYESLNADLWIFYDTNISSTAGIHLLKQPAISFRNFTNETKFNSLVSLIQSQKLKKIYVFDFSKNVPNAYMNVKRKMELSSDEFQKLLQTKKYSCKQYAELKFIGYRECNYSP